MTDPIDDGWGAHRMFVQRTLTRIESGQGRLEQRMRAVETNVVVLKVKAAIWASISAIVVSAIVASVVAKLIT